MRSISRRQYVVRLPAVVLVIIFIAGTIAWFFLVPLEARYWARRVPVLKQTPTSVRDSSTTESTGRKIAFCGSAFEIPWSDFDDAKTKTRGNSTTLFFGSGLVIVLKCQPPREFVQAVLSSTRMSPDKFSRAFGEGALKSDFALTSLMLETIPEAISFHTPHDQQGPLMAMLVLKAMAAPPAASGMFTIHAKEFDGFQYQDPQASPQWVLLDLFAEDRGLEF